MQEKYELNIGAFPIFTHGLFLYSHRDFYHGHIGISLNEYRKSTHFFYPLYIYVYSL